MGRDIERDDSDSLRDIATWLTVPASAGIFLSARDFQRIGVDLGIGGTPANRRFAVEQLFRAAAIEDRLPALFDALISEIEAHRASYRDCDSRALDWWDTRASETVHRLSVMRDVARSESSA